jgi:lia operon protein LiaF
MDNRKRNTAILLIVAGLFIVLGNVIGFFTVAALLMIWFGIHKLRIGEQRNGYLLLAVAALILISGHFGLFIAILLISLGYFFLRSRQVQGPDYEQRHKLLESLKHVHEPWELRNVSSWAMVGEIYLDLSLALTNQRDTTLVFQGLIGNIDLLVPEDLGVSIRGTIVLGQTQVEEQREAGLMNKVLWTTDNYDTADQRVHIEISYLIGDLHVKRI